MSEQTLLFDVPAEKFYESCPVGNGRLGAMLFGGVEVERLILNELTLWSGSPYPNDREGAQAALPEIRRLLWEGKNPEAEAVLLKSFVCAGRGTGFGNGANDPYGSYQVLADLNLRFSGGSGEASGYRRTLDLETATAKVEFSRGGVGYVREIFASKPDNVLALRLTSTRPDSLAFEASLSRPDATTTTLPGGDIELRGQLPNGQGGGGMRYAARIRTVRRGNEALVLIAAGTDFRRKALPDLKRTLDRAESQGWSRLRERHVKEYRKLYSRVSLTWGGGRADLPLPKRLVAAQSIPDPALAALLFQYGRYLLISSSRPGGLPANLQGLWAETIQTPWNGDYHLNINLQMNYWLAEPTNLAECHEPLFDHIEGLVEPGKKTARAYYGASGWVAHVVSNPWGFTSPGEGADWGSTNNGGAWLCAHLWERWAFGQDRRFLARAYPTLKGAAQFYLDFLTTDPRTGHLVTAPSNSPENGFRMADGRVAHTCAGPTMDIQIVRELFARTAEAARTLGVDSELIVRLDDARKRLPDDRVGSAGQLLEWQEEYDEAEPRHRHVSHLYALHPGDQIGPKATPSLARAARTTLERRGDDGTGWSLAWKVAFWARLWDGARAWKLLTRFLRPTGSAGFNMTNGGGVYANLFCAHPPFQIDGNFGVTAAIAELLLQSHERSGDGGYVLHLLPALPPQTPDGSVTGLRARGGLTVDIHWRGGRLERAVLRASAPTVARVRVAGSETIVERKLGRGGRWTIA